MSLDALMKTSFAIFENDFYCITFYLNEGLNTSSIANLKFNRRLACCSFDIPLKYYRV